MPDNLYKKVERFVVDAFTKMNDKYSIKHLLRTVHWLKVIKPDASEALLISAVAHDIEKGFRDHENYNFFKNSKDGFKSNDHLNHHQEQGAKIIGDYLEKLGADENLVSRVEMLVLKHEVGGDEEQNLLKDADSISFLETKVDYFINNKVSETSVAKVKAKFDWMFDRISSEKAKKLAQPFYEEAIKKLENLA